MRPLKGPLPRGPRQKDAPPPRRIHPHFLFVSGIDLLTQDTLWQGTGPDQGLDIRFNCKRVQRRLIVPALFDGMPDDGIRRVFPTGPDHYFGHRELLRGELKVKHNFCGPDHYLLLLPAIAHILAHDRMLPRRQIDAIAAVAGRGYTARRSLDPDGRIRQDIPLFVPDGSPKPGSPGGHPAKNGEYEQE